MQLESIGLISTYRTTIPDDRVAWWVLEETKLRLSQAGAWAELGKMKRNHVDLSMVLLQIPATNQLRQNRNLVNKRQDRN